MHIGMWKTKTFMQCFCIFEGQFNEIDKLILY